MAKNTGIDYAQIEQGISTVLSPDIHFKGNLKFKTSLMVKGRVTGTIEAEGHLVIGPHARVEATVSAGRITNYGEIIGNVEARKTLEMKTGSQQTGDVEAQDFIIETGCSLNGSVKMPEQKKQ